MFDPRLGRSKTLEMLESRRLLANPLGAEFHTNTFTLNAQSNAVTAMDASGDFVVVWESTSQDFGVSTGIYAQRFTRTGVPLGGEFRVNSFTFGNQFAPSVAMNADGDFVVAWMSEAQDGSGTGVYAQTFNAFGAALGFEFRVNTYTTNDQSNPVVAIDGGDFVIAWESAGQDGSSFGVYARRFSAGSAQGSEFRVNTFTTGNQRGPAVAMGTGGRFVLAWRSSGQDGDEYGVYAQRYNAAGSADGSEFRVNTHTADDQRNPTLGIDGTGDFVVAWQSYGQDGSVNGVYAQRYNATGTPQGSEFRVNTYTSTSQRFASLAMDLDGDFVITWESYNGQDGSNTGVYAQAYNAAGAPQGSEFRVNTFTGQGQRRPALAMDADGDFVVAWDSDTQEGNFSGIYAQRFGEVFATEAAGKLTVAGTSGNDTITIHAQAGSLVATRNGASLFFEVLDVTAIEVYGVEGNDRVTIGSGVIGSYVLGGPGNDTLQGGSGNDALVGAAGFDTIRGGGGADRVAGGKHADQVFGEDGDDRVYGDEAADNLDGGAGRDRMYGGIDNDTMLGGNQNDTMYGEAGSDSLHGGNHSDRLFPGLDSDTADGGAGNDNISDVDGSIDNLIGGADVDGHDSDVIDLISLFEFEL